jgi:hypothetical protein
MPVDKLLDWMAYAEVEPFGSTFDDMRSGQIVQTLSNIYRDRKKHPLPLPLKNFLLHQHEVVTRKKQTWQEQKSILQQMVKAFTPPEKKGK